MDKRNRRPPLTQERLKSVLSYCPTTGHFVWIAKYCQKVVVGRRAGSPDSAGYIKISIDGVSHYAHRLAFLYVTGVMPVQIDHEDGVGSNNRWSNLRPATHQQNLLNAKLPIHNTSGSKGVSWHRGAQKWSATIKVMGKKRHLGLFQTTEAAGAAYLAAAQLIEPGFARAA